jgi:hypothetical protein
MMSKEAHLGILDSRLQKAFLGERSFNEHHLSKALPRLAPLLIFVKDISP